MKKTLLITGAAKRLGRIIIEHFDNKGWNIAFSYNESKTEAETLTINKPHIKAYQGFLGDNEFTHNLIARIQQDFGKIDLLINNASIFTEKSFIDSTATDLQQNININLTVPYILNQNYIKTFNTGNIINITDAMIKNDSSSSFFPYLLSKKSLSIFNTMLKKQFPSFNITELSPLKILTDKEQKIEKRAKTEKETIANFLKKIELSIRTSPIKD